MREFVGKVVSNRMMKTVLVAVTRLKAIPKYKRSIRRTKKFMAHDEKNDCNVGDTVRIHMSRPLSKNKAWIVTDVLRREKVYDANEAAAKARRVIAEMQARKQQGQMQGFAAAGATVA